MTTSTASCGTPQLVGHPLQQTPLWQVVGQSAAGSGTPSTVVCGTPQVVGHSLHQDTSMAGCGTLYDWLWDTSGGGTPSTSGHLYGRLWDTQ